MNKPIAIGLAALGLLIAGVIGGYVYTERAVAQSFEAAIADTSKFEGIQSARYDRLDVNLIGNQITIKGLKAQIDPNVLADNIQSANPNADISIDGTVTDTIDTVLVQGIWGLMLGGQTLDRLVLRDHRVDFDIQFTDQAAKGASPAYAMNGEILGSRVQFGDLDIAPLMNGSVTMQDLKNLQAGMVGVDNLVAEISAGDGSSNAAPSSPGMRVIYKIRNINLQDIAAERLGKANMTDIHLEVRSPKAPFPPVIISAASLDMGEMLYKDAVPTKASYDIKNLSITREGAPVDPKLAALRKFLDVEEITVDVKAAYDFDQETGDGTFGPVGVTIHQLGNAIMTIDLEGLPTLEELNNVKMQNDPQNIAQNQARMRRLFNQSMLKHVSLAYEDQGGLRKFIQTQAEQKTNGNIEAVADALARQGAGMVGMSHGPDKAQEVYAVLKDFLADPDALNVELIANQPVKVIELATKLQVAGPLALSALDLQVTSP